MVHIQHERHRKHQLEPRIVKLSCDPRVLSQDQLYTILFRHKSREMEVYKCICARIAEVIKVCKGCHTEAQRVEYGIVLAACMPREDDHKLEAVSRGTHVPLPPTVTKSPHNCFTTQHRAIIHTQHPSATAYATSPLPTSAPNHLSNTAHFFHHPPLERWAVAEVCCPLLPHPTPTNAICEVSTCDHCSIPLS